MKMLEIVSVIAASSQCNPSNPADLSLVHPECSHIESFRLEGSEGVVMEAHPVYDQMIWTMIQHPSGRIVYHVCVSLPNPLVLQCH